MSESRRPPRRGRGRRPSTKAGAETTDNPYRDEAAGADGGEPGGADSSADTESGTERQTHEPRSEVATVKEAPVERPSERPAERAAEPPRERAADQVSARPVEAPDAATEATPDRPSSNGTPRYEQPAYPRDRTDRGERPDGGGGGGFHDRRNGRRHRRGRGRGPRREHQQQPQPQQPVQIAAAGETRGWFDPARDAGFIRRSTNSYLAEPGDAYVPPHLVRQFQLRKADLIDAAVGYDQRGRPTVVEVRTINDADPAAAARRPEFNSLTASYPERKLFMETGRPARGGP
jgi:transcription termination factor Rho